MLFLLRSRICLHVMGQCPKEQTPMQEAGAPGQSIRIITFCASAVLRALRTGLSTARHNISGEVGIGL